MNTKRKGRQKDFKSVALFEKCGAVECCVSAASLGTFDVIGWGKAGGIFVQNKTNSLPPSKEMLGLLNAKIPPGWIKAMIVWIDYQRFPNFYLIEKDALTPIGESQATELLRRTFNG